MAVGTQDLKFRVLAQVLGGQAIDQLGKSLNSLNSQAKLVTNGLKALAGVYSVKEAIDFGKNLLDVGDSLNKLSAKTGASVEQLAKLREQAELADVPFDGLTNALKKLSVNMVEAVNGNAEMSAAFQKLGISIVDANGHVKTSGDVLEAIQAKFAKLADGPAKAALAVKLFGKSGSDLIPLLNGAGDEVSAFARALDTEFAGRAEKFNDTLKLIGLNLKGGALDGLKEMLPALQQIGDAFKDVSAQKSSTVGLFEGLGEAARLLALTLATVLTPLVDLIDASITGFREMAAAIKGDTQQISELDRALAGRVRSRQETKDRFGASLIKDSLVLGDGTADEIRDRQRKATLPPKKKPGSNLDADGIGTGAKIIQEFQAKLDKMKAETLAYGQNNAVKEQAVLFAELESKGLLKTSAAYQKLAGQIVVVTSARETAKEKDQATQFQDNARAEIEIQRAQLTQTTMYRAEYEKMIEAKRIDQETSKATRNFTAEGAQAYRDAAEAVKQEKLALIDLEEQQRRTWVTGAKQAMVEYVDAARDTAAQTKELFMHAFQNMEDSLVNFVKTGKLNFAKFADDIITDIIRIQVRAVIAQSITGASGLFSGLFSSGASGAATTTAGGAADAAGTSTVAYAANGGIMSSGGMLPLNKYANGGVAKSPQVAIFGEGRMNEAYVPLPDGRSIPVSMKGAKGGDTNVSVNVNMDSGATDTNASGSKAADLGRLISNAVRNELVTQRRPGGLLA